MGRYNVVRERGEPPTERERSGGVGQSGVGRAGKSLTGVRSNTDDSRKHESKKITRI